MKADTKLVVFCSPVVCAAQNRERYARMLAPSHYTPRFSQIRKREPSHIIPACSLDTFSLLKPLAPIANNSSCVYLSVLTKKYFFVAAGTSPKNRHQRTSQKPLKI
jgi:hypothetical protein